MRNTLPALALSSTLLFSLAVWGPAVHGELPDVGYPRILIHNFDPPPPLTEPQIAALARRDLIILAPQYRNDHADIRKIRQRNPRAVILQYAMTQQAAFDDSMNLGNDDEAAQFRTHGRAWLRQKPWVPLPVSLPAGRTETRLPGMTADVLQPGTILVLGDELVDVLRVHGDNVVLRRGHCGTQAVDHPAGTPVARVAQPNWAVQWYGRVSKSGETLTLNMSDRAPAIDGRQPWQIKADFLIDRYWNDPQWREAFDGFFLDEGQVPLAASFDVDGDGRADPDSYASIERGIRKFSRRLRERGGSELIVVFNNAVEIYPEANGRHREHFVDQVEKASIDITGQWFWAPAVWGYGMEPYRAWCDLAFQPTVYLNSAQPGTWDDYRRMRFSLASSLLDDGYFQYRARSGDQQNWRHWFDEYSVDENGRATDGASGRHWLGQPTGAARQLLGPLTSENLVEGAAWSLRGRGGSDTTDGTLHADGGTIDVTVHRSPDSQADSLQVEAGGRGTLEPGDAYTFSLETRASTPRLVDFSVVDEQGNTNSAKILIPVYVRRQWQRHVFTCIYRGTQPMAGYRLRLAVGNDLGQVCFRNVAWQQGVAERGWTRRFERGIVVVNPTPLAQTFEGLDGYRRICGTQDPRHNNGRPVPAELLVEPWDAYLLQKSPPANPEQRDR